MATAAQMTALRNLISDLVTSSAAQKINFYLDMFKVDGSGFYFLALALLSKPTRGHGLSIQIKTHQPAGVEAQYHPSNNTFEFPSATYGTNAFQRMMIIHECVHALRDSQGRLIRTSLGLMNTRALSDEAAAYLAGALFHIFDTTAPGTAPTTPSWALAGPNAAVFAAAHALAVTMSTRMGFAVAPSGAKTLRDAVMNNPVYLRLKLHPNMSYGNNGLNL